MKKRKVACMVLTSAMLFSTVAGVAGCSKNGKENGNGTKSEGNGVSTAIVNDIVEVEDDSEWFNYTKRELNLISNPEKYDYTYIDTIYPTKDGYIVTYQCYSEDSISADCHMVELDKDFNIKSDTSLSASQFGLREGFEININKVTILNDDIYASVNAYLYNENTFEYEDKSIIYNLTKNEAIDLDYLNEKVSEDAYPERAGVGADGTVFLTAYCYSANGASYDLILGQDGKYVKTIDVGKAISMNDVWMIEFVSSKDGKITFEAFGDDQTLYFSVDTSDWSVEVEGEVDSYNSTGGFIAEDGTSYYIDVFAGDGIYADGELVMPFSSTYINLNKIQYGTVLDASDDHYVVQTTEYKNNASEMVIYTFDKADSNPNVGKTVLKLGCFGYPYGATAEAISLFNQSSDKYFLELDIYDIYSEYEDPFDGDYEGAYITLQGDATNKLTMDLLNGEGPDLILDAATISQLNNEEYLYDISEIVDEISGVELFDNVIDASKVNGKLFHMPLAFEVDGIFALKKDVKGDKGFTFDEYVEYVDKVCNGKNPMAYYSRNEVLRECLSAMSEDFFDEDGNVSFKNQSFYNLAAYCLENVPEKVDWDEIYPEEYYGPGVGYSIGDSNPLTYTEISSIYTYIYARQKYKNDVGLYGIPSNDGRGPVIRVNNSIAVSAACSDYEGAKEFIKFFFKDDSKSIWSEFYTNPIVVERCKENSKTDVDNNNANFERQLKYSTEAELNSWGEYRVDESIIDDYISILKSADSVKTIDSSIYGIVMEEIPAYFAGQKKIEDVAAIIEDRAQTVIDERG